MFLLRWTHSEKLKINRRLRWHNTIFSSVANLAKRCSAMESSRTNYNANSSMFPVLYTLATVWIRRKGKIFRLHICETLWIFSFTNLNVCFVFSFSPPSFFPILQGMPPEFHQAIAFLVPCFYFILSFLHKLQFCSSVFLLLKCSLQKRRKEGSENASLKSSSGTMAIGGQNTPEVTKRTFRKEGWDILKMHYLRIGGRGGVRRGGSSMDII